MPNVSTRVAQPSGRHLSQMRDDGALTGRCREYLTGLNYRLWGNFDLGDGVEKPAAWLVAQIRQVMGTGSPS